MATVGGTLCRQCAEQLEGELGAGTRPPQPLPDFERFARGAMPLSEVISEGARFIFGGLFTEAWPTPQQPPSRPRPGAGARSRPAPPRSASPPPPRPAPHPQARAREVLGFEPQQRITAEIVNDRRRQLAKVFHPDKPGGSTAQMQRVNEAADLLLSKLA